MSTQNNSLSYLNLSIKSSSNLLPKLNSISQTYSDEYDIDYLITQLTLKKKRSAFNIYISDKYDEIKKNNPNFMSSQIFDILNKNWSEKLSKEEKEKYKILANEEKKIYEREKEIMRQYYKNLSSKEKSTAYRKFLNSRLNEGIKNEEEPKNIKIKAIKDWSKMSKEEKLNWQNKIDNNENWWDRAKQSKNISSYCVFVQKKIEDAKEKNEEILNFDDCAKIWKKMSKNKKKIYEAYAEEINEERKNMREIYEIINGIQPKKPAGAYKIFLSEKIKEGELKGKNIYKDGKKMWNELPENEKEEYLKKAKKIKLCYIYKKMLYKKNNRKILPPKPKNAYNYFIASLKGIKPKNGENFFQMTRRLWNKMDEDKKQKFNDLAEEDIRKYEMKMVKFEDKIYDIPERAKGAFQMFIMDKFPLLKEKNKDLPTYVIFSMISDEWKELNDDDKNIYEKMAIQDKERFLIQNEEFKENGYYSKDKFKNHKENEIKENGKRRSITKSQCKKRSVKK